MRARAAISLGGQSRPAAVNGADDDWHAVMAVTPGYATIGLAAPIDLPIEQSTKFELVNRCKPIYRLLENVA